MNPLFSLRILVLSLSLLLVGQAAASPSAFFENAAFASLGLGPGLSLRVGGEALVPVPFVDAALGGELVLYAAGAWQSRVSLSTLVFPAMGTTPPLAVGVGADVGFGSRGASVHVGPLVGSDLLFTLNLPLTASFYLAPGYSSRGFSLAWAVQARYYLDNVALEFETSDLQLISLGARILF